MMGALQFSKVILVSICILFVVPFVSSAAMPSPTGQQAYSYPARIEPSLRPHNIPADVEPIGVGTVAAGGNTLSLRVWVESYAQPVDLYFGLYAPGPLQLNEILLLDAGMQFLPLSQSGLVPWKSNVTTANDFLFGNIPASALPPGEYFVYLLALPAGTPPGDLSNFHLWSTRFTIVPSGSGDYVDPTTPGYIELGSGTDAFGQYASEENVKGKVLSVEKLNADGQLTLNKSVQEGMVERVSGTTISEYAKDLGLSVGVSGRYMWFSASIETAFTQSITSSSEYSFVTLRERHFKHSLRINNLMWRNPDYLKPYLTPEADMVINDDGSTWSGQDVIDTYGTHVMLGIYIGARLDYNLAIKITDQSYQEDLEVYAEAKAGNRFANASFNTDFNQSTYSAMSSYEQREFTQCKGGNEQWANPSNKDDYEDWRTSLDTNPAFVGIMEGALLPIWELADDPDRAKQIEVAFLKRSAESTINVDPLPVITDIRVFVAPYPGSEEWQTHVSNPLVGRTGDISRAYINQQASSSSLFPDPWYHSAQKIWITYDVGKYSLESYEPPVTEIHIFPGALADMQSHIAAYGAHYYTSMDLNDDTCQELKTEETSAGSGCYQLSCGQENSNHRYLHFDKSYEQLPLRAIVLGGNAATNSLYNDEQKRSDIYWGPADLNRDTKLDDFDAQEVLDNVVWLRGENGELIDLNAGAIHFSGGEGTDDCATTWVENPARKQYLGYVPY